MRELVDLHGVDCLVTASVAELTPAEIWTRLALASRIGGAHWSDCRVAAQHPGRRAGQARPPATSERELSSVSGLNFCSCRKEKRDHLSGTVKVLAGPGKVYFNVARLRNNLTCAFAPNNPWLTAMGQSWKSWDTGSWLPYANKPRAGNKRHLVFTRPVCCGLPRNIGQGVGARGTSLWSAEKSGWVLIT